MKKIMLLGSGELGKEFTIAAKRAGQYECVAKKILIPVNRCSVSVVGVQDKTLSEYVRDAVAMLKNMQ